MLPSVITMLLAVLSVCINFPAVAGDCFDSNDNAKSYGNCCNCYETLANALMNSADNKYRLGKAFFPKDAAKPVVVEVQYTELDKINTDECASSGPKMTWYWLMGEYYIYQPLDVFLYRSLFFSPPRWRQGSVILCLPEQCFNVSDTSEEYFEYLTQRLPAYATYQTVKARVEESYVGVAVRGDEPVTFGDRRILGRVKEPIVPLVFIIPYLAVLLVLIIGGFVCRINWTIIVTHIPENTNTLATIAAATVICSLFTIYIFCLDMYSLAREDSNQIPQYFKARNYGIYGITVAFSITSFICNLIGIIAFILFVFHKTYSIPIFFCVGSTILQLSFHFQNILIAWSTDAFYASRIALYYGVVIFCYQLSFKYAFLIPHYLKWQKKKCWIICLYIFTFIFITGTLATVSIFIVHMPINNSIEESVSGVTAIYNGVVVLIGALIAYKVGSYCLTQKT